MTARKFSIVSLFLVLSIVECNTAHPTKVNQEPRMVLALTANGIDEPYEDDSLFDKRDTFGSQCGLGYTCNNNRNCCSGLGQQASCCQSGVSCCGIPSSTDSVCCEGFDPSSLCVNSSCCWKSFPVSCESLNACCRPFHVCCLWPVINPQINTSLCCNPDFEECCDGNCCESLAGETCCRRTKGQAVCCNPGQLCCNSSTDQPCYDPSIEMCCDSSVCSRDTQVCCGGGKCCDIGLGCCNNQCCGTPGNGPPLVAIILPVIIVLGIGIIALLLLFFCRRRKKVIFLENVHGLHDQYE